MRKFGLLLLIITYTCGVFATSGLMSGTKMSYVHFPQMPDTLGVVTRINDAGNQIRREAPPSAFASPALVGASDSVVYDQATRRYVVKPVIDGKYPYARPYSVSLQDYMDYQNKLSLFDYNRRKVKDGEQYDFKELVSQIQFLDNILNPIFGDIGFKLNMQGTVELTLGAKINRVDNPTIPVDLRKTTSFDFDEKIQFNINGGIGDLINLDWSYNTDATFDFENILKLNYEGKEDDIVKKIEAGNVSLPLPGTLISGGRDLWGFRADLQFGKLTVSSIFSQQKSESNVIQLDKGGQKQEYEISALNYEANKHFFLSKYFRNTYDQALEKLPNIRSGITITRIEVWVTNKNSNFEKARNIVAFVDLAENTGNISNMPIARPLSGNMPANGANSLYGDMTTTYASIRDINNVTNTFAPLGSQFSSGRDYEKVENARLLDPSEYILNDRLGYISLNQGLNSDEVLAVAYEYTYRGEIFTVGELTAEGAAAPSTLFVKMLKSTAQSPKLPTWDLMMKNVYGIGAYGLSADDFIMDILYQNDKVGTKVNYVPAGDIKDKMLLSVLNMDRLNTQSDAIQDGRFDYIEGVTVYASKGRIVFPVLEPFGAYLRQQINNPSEAEQYVFDSLYTQTQSDAEKQTQKNKFYLKGSYKSSSSSEISLESFNVAEGSVSVIANGVELTENIDYIVDYAGGTVQIINQSLLASGAPITIKSENRSGYGMQTRSLVGTHMNYQFNEKFNLGATMMYMNEKPITHKVNIGDEPISNLIWGLNASYNTESGFLTTLVDKIPFIDTKVKSSISIDGEFAHFTPGTSKGAGGNAYIDDFEGSKMSIDMKAVTQWKLASTPHDFPEGSLSNDYVNGFNRAKLAWYVIDPLFYRMSNATPSHIRDDKLQRSNHYVREIRQTEIFPNRDIVVGDVNIISALSLAYYPEEKGPYNYDVSPNSYSRGINSDGKLNDPETRWGGIMRSVQSNDFEAANVQYIEMWLLDPFIYNEEHRGGEVYIELGNVSEDILRDGRKSFENGLPVSADIVNVDTTVWGRVSTVQSIVNGFDNNSQSRRFQDVGLDGLNVADERVLFNGYLQNLMNTFGANSLAYRMAMEDPSGDNYHYFRGSDYDAERVPVLERYKKYNGTEGNAPTTEMSPESYSTAATNLPDVEDINGDNTLNETESFFRYKLRLDPTTMQVGQNYIANITSAAVSLPNGEIDTVRWFQIKIPLNTAERTAVGAINDLKSVRFMRMILKGFQDSVILRFASLDLVRDNWRKEEEALDDQPVLSNSTVFDVSAVNLEENATKTPVNYLMPLGIERVVDVTNPQYKELNEQSMLLKVVDLESGDARGVYKQVNYDMLRYKVMKMDVHAEAVSGDELRDGDLTLFLRMGGDNVNNYYEYEIPLVVTPPGQYPDNDLGRLAVWPAKNRIELPLRLLQLLKQKRNSYNREGGDYSEVFSMRISELDGSVNSDILDHILKVKGRPSLGEIKNIVIGIRNPETNAVHSAEIWINELRLSDFDNKGGWAGNLRMTTKLADLATLTLAGSRISPGFGSIEQSISEISRSDYRSIDFSANVEFGKFFPEKWGIRMPMYYAYSRQATLPEYDPLDTDIPLDVALDNAADDRARDSIKRNAEDFIMRKSLNFTNIGILTNQEKSKILDISNLSLTYSQNKEFAYNVNTERDIRKDYRGLLSYIYNGMPEIVEPFKDSKFLSSSSLKLLRDFNFYYLPTMLSFTSDISRNYREVTTKNLDNPDFLILPSVEKDFMWQRDYALKFNLTRNLSLDFKAAARARIDEPEGIVDKELDPDGYARWKDTVLTNIKDGGRPVNYNHDVTVNYRVPVDKLPGFDWTTLQTLYSARYDWEAAPITDDSTNHGNVIRNSNSLQLSAGLSLTTLYSKSKFIRDISRPARRQTKPVNFTTGVEDMKKNKSFVVTHNLKTKDIRVKLTTPDGKQVNAGYENVGNNKVRITPTQDMAKVTVAVSGSAKPEVSPVKSIARIAVGLLTSVKNIRVSYSGNNSSTLPGFLPEARWLGQERHEGRSAPGFHFLFGGQREDFGIRSAEKGWVTTDTTLNTPYIMNQNTSVTVTSLVEPVKKLRIDLRMERSRSKDRSEYLWYDGNNFTQMNQSHSGTFSMSIIGLKSAFSTIGSDIEASAAVYRRFLENRKDVSKEFAMQRYGDAYGNYELKEDGKPTGFYEGYGATAQDVLIASFNRAYHVGDHGGLIPKLLAMRPNWRLTYTGLTDIPFMKKFFNSFNLSHSYRCRYTIGSYSSNLKYEEENGFSTVMFNGNWLPQFDVNTISISEEFNPLINVDMAWINNLTTRFSLIRKRDISLSVTNSQIMETASNELVIGAGYRFSNLPIFFDNKQLDNDINLMCDFSIRKNNAIIRRISENVDQLTAGQKVMSLNISADYTFNNRFNVRVFYDRVVNTPYVSLSFPTYNTNFGVSVRFSLSQ